MFVKKSLSELDIITKFILPVIEQSGWEQTNSDSCGQVATASDSLKESNQQAKEQIQHLDQFKV